MRALFSLTKSGSLGDGDTIGKTVVAWCPGDYEHIRFRDKHVCGMCDCWVGVAFVEQVNYLWWLQVKQ